MSLDVGDEDGRPLPEVGIAMAVWYTLADSREEAVERFAANEVLSKGADRTNASDEMILWSGIVDERLERGVLRGGGGGRVSGEREPLLYEVEDRIGNY